jgi:RNA polymerase sigma-70 factor (ECF subfamily)
VAATRPDVTRLLNDASGGDEDALNRLLPLVYGELRELAVRHMQSERSDHTLQPTALAHEAYLRLVGASEISWKSRAQFFAVAAQAMRRILVDHARKRKSAKRGGGRARVPLEFIHEPTVTDRKEYVLAVDEALQRLVEIDPQATRVVELRFFGGLAVEEIAQVLGVSDRTVKRDWHMAKAWLLREIASDEDGR